MPLQILVNGNDLTEYYKSGSLTWTELIGGEKGNASFTMQGPEASNLRYKISRGFAVAINEVDSTDTVVKEYFTGIVVRSPQTNVIREEDLGYFFTYEVTAADATDPVSDVYVSEVWENKTTMYVLKDVIDRYCPSLDTSGINTALGKTMQYYAVDSQSVKSVIDELTAYEGWTWYLDADEVKMGPVTVHTSDLIFNEVIGSLYNIDDLSGMGLTVDPGDSSQLRNVVYYNFKMRYSKGLCLPTVGSNVILAMTTPDSNGDTPEWSGNVIEGSTFAIPGSGAVYTVKRVSSAGNVVLSSEVESADGCTVETTITGVTSTTVFTVASATGLAIGDWLYIEYQDSTYAERQIQNIAGNVITLTAALPSLSDLSPDNSVQKLQTYYFQDIPMEIKLRDSVSIEALRQLLYDSGKPSTQQDPGVREYVYPAPNEQMTFEQGFQRAQAELYSYSNPLVRFVVPTNSWFMQQAGFANYKAGQSARFNLPLRGITTPQIIKSITYRDTGGLMPGNRTFLEIEFDFSDRLFALHNIIGKIKEEIRRVGNDRKLVRDILDIIERLIAEENPDDEEFFQPQLETGGEDITTTDDVSWLVNRLLATEIMMASESPSTFQTQLSTGSESFDGNADGTTFINEHTGYYTYGAPTQYALSAYGS